VGEPHYLFSGGLTSCITKSRTRLEVGSGMWGKLADGPCICNDRRLLTGPCPQSSISAFRAVCMELFASHPFYSIPLTISRRVFERSLLKLFLVEQFSPKSPSVRSYSCQTIHLRFHFSFICLPSDPSLAIIQYVYSVRSGSCSEG
jgi:hypothetical protein